ncbi:hypothetical protein [Flavobacterium sp.]|uniref:hypothetical protein n=1 Tax=Flavobacterium sp. TaxID=239 RepID=UPI00121DD137|nr:hypothetical protein [Flavobacterium sp.]RZJ69795.1 MAG: hypothetical protein EOO49_16175 [Flavobacterium sp.]
MKNITAILLLFWATVGFAQRTSEEKATALTTKMQTQIGFNDDTKAKVQAINLEFVNKTSALKTTGGDKRERVGNLRKLDEERAEALKKVFTETEYAAFEKFRQENRREMRQKVRDRKS